MLKIECKGMRFAEAKELADHLKTQNGVKNVEFWMHSNQRGSSQGMNARLSDVWIVVDYAVGTAIGGSAAVAVKAVVEESSKDVYKWVRDWLTTKFTGKSAVEVGVTLYGPDGELIEKVSTKR